jgi:hypothetical protein
MSQGKLLMTETIKNRGWLEQGKGDLAVYILCPLTLELLTPNK